MDLIRNMFYVAPSTGKGKGLFAAKNIEPGEVLFIAFARAEFSKIAPTSKNFESHFIQLYPNNFVNNDSVNPNSQNFWMGELYIVKRAIRKIVKDEEIVSNYTNGMNIIRERGYHVSNWLNF